MNIQVVTLFPRIFAGYLEESLLGKAQERRLVQIELVDLRQWGEGPHRRVDDRPYGGGPGMILMADPVVRCVEELRQRDATPAELVLLTPQGEPLRQPLVEQWATRPRLILLCGRYEGFDQRIIDVLQPREVSIGDYVLNGGEVAAMVVIDAVVRLIPGVLGEAASCVEDSLSHGQSLLEFPQYTRPREYRGLAVPEILLSGHHAAIEQWRREQSLHRTRQRPDLLPPDAG